MASSKIRDSGEVTPEDVRVLVVDNDKALAHSMCESLERVGYPVTVATSGRLVIRVVSYGSSQVLVS